MDPYSAEGELINIHTAFHQGQYQAVLDTPTTGFSASNALPARLLKLRAHLALHDPAAVLSSISPSEASKSPDLAAARLLASYLSAPSPSLVADAQQSPAATPGAQVLLGTLLAAAGEHDAALAALRRHEGSLDAVALIVQVYLAQNRADLAAKEARAARGFAQDALIVNLAEAWVGMREGGEKYQQAYYVFEELAQGPSTQAPASLVAQAVSELHLGRYEEAATALQQALALDAGNADALANKAVLEAVLGKRDEADAAVKKLGEVDGAHPLLVDIESRRAAFEAAAAKYSPKFEP